MKISKFIFNKFGCIFLCCGFLFNLTAHAIVVEKTADTAVAAKSAALDDAKRIAFASVLGQHLSVDEAKKLATEIPADELNDLTESILIEGEKSDATSYSADIIVEFQNIALNKWMENRGIPGVQSAPVAAGRAPVFLELDGLSDFAKIMRASRETGADLRIIGISGGRVSANVRENTYQSFVTAVRAGGVTVSY